MLPLIEELLAVIVTAPVAVEYTSRLAEPVEVLAERAPEREAVAERVMEERLVIALPQLSCSRTVRTKSKLQEGEVFVLLTRICCRVEETRKLGVEESWVLDVSVIIQ